MKKVKNEVRFEVYVDMTLLQFRKTVNVFRGDGLSLIILNIVCL